MDIVLNKDLYYHETYHMGLVNDKDQFEIHDGKVKVVNQKGEQTNLYDPYDYLDNIAEASEPWSYEKFPYLKKPGYKGLVDGPDSGLYRASPLSRLNVCKEMPTPLAQDALVEYRGILNMFEDPSGETVTAPLRAFFGEMTARPRRRKSYPLALLNNKVNLDQLLAINNAMRYPLAYVQGPPGTGKTNTIVNLSLIHI